MMKRVLYLFFFLAIKLLGQVNYVLNYSFEEYINCELGNCTFVGVNNWYQPTITGAAWFSHSCFGSSATEGVPQNFAGYQYARTGQCYAAVLVADTVNGVNYITGMLVDSLNLNKKYCVAFYVSLCDSVWWAVSEIGAYFSNDSICNESYSGVLSYTPQIENPSGNYITNKIDWVPISGEFQSAGGERFITIGGFQRTTLSDYDSVGHGGTVAGFQSEVQTAYYVDDVYVRELTIASAGKSDSICAGDSVMIGQDTTTIGVSFSWQPTPGLSNPNIAQPIASPTHTTTYTLTVTNDSIHNCNCADSVTKDSIVINVCTGINEIVHKVSSKVYPNPNNGIFTLALSHAELVSASQTMIEIYNVFGENVLTETLRFAQGDNRINVQNEPSGIYLYRVTSLNGSLIGTGKFIIE